MGKAERRARRRARRANRRARRQQRRKNVREGLRKVGRGIGTVLAAPIAGSVAAGRARRSGASRGKVAGAFFEAADPTRPIRDITEGSAELTGATAELITGDERVGGAITAGGKIGAVPMRGPARDVSDQIRSARELGSDFGSTPTARAKAKAIGEMLVAPASGFAGDTLESLSDLAAAVEGAPVPESVKAGIHRIFGTTLELDGLKLADGPIFGALGRDSTTATTAPRIIWLGDGHTPHEMTGATPTPLTNAHPAELAAFGSPQYKLHSVFVHELVHTWQYQHSGSDYMPKALLQQAMHFTPGYDWLEAWDRFGPRWITWPEESAASFIQALHDYGMFEQPGVPVPTASQASRFVSAMAPTSSAERLTQAPGLIAGALDDLRSGRSGG